MKAHPKELGVQMAATACLYNLSKGEMGQKIHPLWLAKLVDLTLDAMKNFPNHQQVSKIYRFPVKKMLHSKSHRVNI